MNQELIDLARQASAEAHAKYAAGEIQLDEHGGRKGVWVNTPLDRFFVEVKSVQSIDLSTPYDHSKVLESDDPNHLVYVWAKGHGRRHQQLQIDTRTGQIKNLEDVIEDLDTEDAIDRHARDEVDEKSIDFADLEMEWFLAEGSDGSLVPLLIELSTGDIVNWEGRGEDVRIDEHPDVTISLAEAAVHEYTRKDGTHVSGYRQGRRDARFELPGHRFLGHARASNDDGSDGEEYEVHQNEKSTNQFALLHGETGEHAEPGTRTSPWEGYSGSNVKGLLQGSKTKNVDHPVAVPDRDIAATESRKREAIMSIAKALGTMEADLAKMKLRGPNTRSATTALAVQMIARHLFRIGDGVGFTKGVETRGLTTLRPKVDAKVQKGDGGHARIEFNFTGKAGKAWLRYEDAPDTVPALAAKIRGAQPGDSLFWYSDRGKHKNLSPEDVRQFLESYGFTPHRFRNYAATYEFYRFVQDYVAEKGLPDTEASRKKLVTAATKSAASLLNDTPGAAKVYILGEMVDEVLATGNVRRLMGLAPLRLSEQESWWLPHEEDFIAWVEHTSPTFHHGIELSEAQEIWLWEPLRDGDRWVTLKPHGPDSEDYARVIIRQHHDGTATVVGGARHLMNLRLTKIGEKHEIEKREKQRSKILTPEAKAEEDQKREARKAAYDQAHHDFGSSVASILGLGGDKADEIAKGYGAGLAKASEPVNKELAESRRRERMERIANGEGVTDKKLKTTIDGTEGNELQRKILEANVMDILGKTPEALGGAVSDEVKAAWDEARKDPEKLTQIAGHAKLLEEKKRELKRAQSASGVIRVMNRMAFTMDDADSDEATRALLSDALKRTEYQMTSRFWQDVENAGAGIRDQFTNGAVEGLTALGAKFGGGSLLDASMIRLIGHEAMAAALAADIRSRGESVAKDAVDGVHSMIEERHLPTVTEAMSIAEEMDKEREQIKAESAAGNLVTAARRAALTQLTLGRQKALGYAAGSLEAAAAVADNLRRSNPQGADIDAGDERDRVLSLLEKAGMTEGQGYELRSAHGEGGHVKHVIHIPEKDLPRLLKAARIQLDLNEEIGAIKNHTAQTGDFHIPGMIDKLTVVDDDGVEKEIPVTLKPGQIASIQMFEHMTAQGPDHGILVNAKVGLGKTLILGASASRALANGATHGIVAVPAFLLKSTEEGLRKFFPDMDIQVAHSDVKKRDEQYRGKHQMMIVSQDTQRGDMNREGSGLNEIRDDLMENGYVFDDEGHLAFTPNENDNPEKQSARSEAFNKLRGRHMMTLTGTPIRRSSAEVWKILNRLRPGGYGTLPQWMSKFGKMGEGVSAFGDSMQDLFQRTIDSATITEDEPAPVEHKKNTKFIDLHPTQAAEYKRLDEEYYAKVANPDLSKEAKRTLVANKVKAQRETLFASSAESNALIGQLHKDVGPLIQSGMRGIVHCTSLAAVESVKNSFKPGEMLTVTGSDSKEERQRLLRGLNTGMPVVGGRASIGDREGVVEKIDSSNRATVRGDDGHTFTTDLYNLESKVVGVAGTSNAAGVLSAGLNLQGTNWNVHFQLPDSGATLKQRDARNLRTGQKQDVHSFYYVPNTPTTRTHWRRLKQDEKRMAFVDDPAAYDSDEFIRNKRVTMGVKSDNAATETDPSEKAA